MMRKGTNLEYGTGPRGTKEPSGDIDAVHDPTNNAPADREGDSALPQADRIAQEDADRAGTSLVEAFQTGDFSGANVDEEAFFPTDAGLFFPLLGDGGAFVGYDDPGAAPFLDYLREAGWEGQTWIVTDKPWYREHA